MKTQPPANLCMIPAPYGAQLTALAPSIAFNVSRSVDSYHSWDGDGPDPRNEGFDPYNVGVTASAIVNGQIVTGEASLGASYFKPDEPTDTVHGYLLQMLDEANADLYRALRGPTADDLITQTESVRAYLKATMRAKYDAQRAEIAAKG